MGITWDDLPSLAFNMLDQSVIPYPKDKPIEKVEMFNWFDRIITRQDPEALKFKDYHRSIEDPGFHENYLDGTLRTDRQNFTHFTLEEGFDTIAFLYSTDKVSQNQRDLAIKFNQFRELAYTQFNLGQ